MAKRRPVANLLALAVLATVVQRPMHPYEMASLLRARGKDADMPIKWGSLYTVVRNLTKHGFLEVEDTTREGGRPERTVYRITEAGHAELVDWVRELVSVPETEHTRFKAGLSVLATLPPDEATELLRRRLASLERSTAEARASMERYGSTVPRLFLIEDEYQLAVLQAESDWIRGLIEELESGSFPQLAVWRTWHETGEPPAELAEPAEPAKHGGTD
ncbi:PadR family transcriptional regulator [Phaeacidiphilus oryzae]|uniref:PadR family transcriptional regulator n=1 Tax=Phaeacidiphilus oryzae TaxID=348818 RepID=UPI00055BA88C|nr:PadR family transcriptional regulator [Phaeacidiphilus oryzae]